MSVISGFGDGPAVGLNRDVRPELVAGSPGRSEQGVLKRYSSACSMTIGLPCSVPQRWPAGSVVAPQLASSRKASPEGEPDSASVVIGADAGQQRDLFPPQPGDAAGAAERGQAGLLGGDPGAPGGQELADIIPGTHDSHATSLAARQGSAVITCFARPSPRSAAGGCMVCASLDRWLRPLTEHAGSS